MAALCAKLTIYRIKEKSLILDVEKQTHLQRKLSYSLISQVKSQNINNS